MKKALKRKIFETVSSLRTLFTKLKDTDAKKTKEINNLTKQVDELGSELKQCRETLMEDHGAPSRAGTTVLELATTPSMNGTIEGGEGRDKIEGASSTVRDTETAEYLARQVALPDSNQIRNYADAVQGPKGKTLKMTMKSIEANPPKN
jgi:hypothetical protein